MSPKTPRFIAHLISVGLIAIAVLTTTGVGFAQSYAGLYHWALEHSLHGWKAESFPLMVDLFILVGEIGLFALALEGHKLSKNWLPWADLALPGGIAAGGWGVSLAFNVGAVGPDLADRLTAAVPPVASMLGLLVLLRTLHRLVGRAAPVQAEVAEVAEVAPAEIVDGVEVERVFSHPQLESAEDGDAGQGALINLDHAVISARAAGMSLRAIAEAFEIKRYRVEKILGHQDPATESATPAALNGQMKP